MIMVIYFIETYRNPIFYARLSFYPRSKKRILRLPVDVVSHHGKVRWEVISLEVLYKGQGGVVLRYTGAEGAEFGEGEIEGHGFFKSHLSFLFLVNKKLLLLSFLPIDFIIRGHFLKIHQGDQYQKVKLVL
jgi:hypothetical protein